MCENNIQGPVKKQMYKTSTFVVTCFFPPVLPLLIITVISSLLPPLLKGAFYGSDAHLHIHRISAVRLHISASEFAFQ